jgi:hypothetical protein
MRATECPLREAVDCGVTDENCSGHRSPGRRCALQSGIEVSPRSLVTGILRARLGVITRAMNRVARSHEPSGESDRGLTRGVTRGGPERMPGVRMPAQRGRPLIGRS